MGNEIKKYRTQVEVVKYFVDEFGEEKFKRDVAHQMINKLPIDKLEKLFGLISEESISYSGNPIVKFKGQIII
jgi:hypothetical protein